MASNNFSLQGVFTLVRLGKGGPLFKAVGSELQARNAADDEYTDFRGNGIIGASVKADGGNLIVSRVDVFDPTRTVTLQGPSGAFASWTMELPAAAPTVVGQGLVVSDLTGGDGGGPLLAWQAQSFELAFTNADLVGGVLTVNHNLGAQFLQVAIYDGNDELVDPAVLTSVTATSTTVMTIDFGAPPLFGTYHVRVSL